MICNDSFIRLAYIYDVMAIDKNLWKSIIFNV